MRIINTVTGQPDEIGEDANAVVDQRIPLVHYVATQAISSLTDSTHFDFGGHTLAANERALFPYAGTYVGIYTWSGSAWVADSAFTVREGTTVRVTRSSGSPEWQQTSVTGSATPVFFRNALYQDTETQVWFGRRGNGETDDGVALQALVTAEAAGARRTIRFLPSNYYFSTEVNLPAGTTTLVGPGTGYVIELHYPGASPPNDSWLNNKYFGGTAGWLAAQAHTTLVNPMAKGDQSIVVADDVAGTIKANSWVLVGEYPTLVLNVTPSGGNKLLTLWRGSRAAVIAGTSVTPMNPAVNMGKLVFDGKGTTLTGSAGRYFSLSRSYRSEIYGFVLADGHLPAQIGSWDNYCLFCDAHDLSGALSAFTAEMNFGPWSCEGGEDCTIRNCSFSGILNFGDWAGENCGAINCLITQLPTGTGVSLQASQGFDSRSCFMKGCEVQGGVTAVFVANNNATDFNYDSFTDINCRFYNQTGKPVDISPFANTGGVYRPVFSGYFEVAPATNSVFYGENYLDGYESGYALKDCTVVSTKGLADTYCFRNACPAVVQNLTLVDIARVCYDAGPRATVKRWQNIRVKYTAAATNIPFEQLGGGDTGQRYIIEDFNLEGSTSGPLSLIPSATTVAEFVRANCPGITSLTFAGSVGQLRLRDTISLPATAGGTPKINVGTIALNGATTVNYAFPDLKATDSVSVTVKTNAGTPGAAPRVIATPGTGLAITGTAGDTSTLQIAIGA